MQFEKSNTDFVGMGKWEIGTSSQETWERKKLNNEEEKQSRLNIRDTREGGKIPGNIKHIERERY